MAQKYHQAFLQKSMVLYNQWQVRDVQILFN